jgi:hypothetical protein
MRKPIAVVLWASCSVVVQPAPSSAASGAHVDLAIGTILSPQDLQRGQQLGPDTTIQSGPDGLVVISQSWGVGGYVCQAVITIGGGRAYTVKDEEVPGDCPLTRPTQGQQGQSTFSTRYRYLPPKTDAPVPAAVQASLNDWAGYDSWIRQESSKPSHSGPSGDTAPSSKPNDDGTPAVGMGPFEYNRSYSGADYRDAIVSTAAECSAICGNEPQCRVFTFIPDQRRCWLKNSVPAWQAAPGMISALKPVAGMGSLEYNRSYSGADYRDSIVSSAAECSAICASEPQCRAMTFIPDQRRCWLKGSVPAWQPAPGMISAVKQ